MQLGPPCLPGHSTVWQRPHMFWQCLTLLFPLYTCLHKLQVLFDRDFFGTSGKDEFADLRFLLVEPVAILKPLNEGTEWREAGVSQSILGILGGLGILYSIDGWFIIGIVIVFDITTGWIALKLEAFDAGCK
jgi:hypothetical protein